MPLSKPIQKAQATGYLIHDLDPSGPAIKYHSCFSFLTYTCVNTTPPPSVPTLVEASAGSPLVYGSVLNKLCLFLPHAIAAALRSWPAALLVRVAGARGAGLSPPQDSIAVSSGERAAQCYRCLQVQDLQLAAAVAAAAFAAAHLP